MEKLNIHLEEYDIAFFLVAKCASSSIKAAIKQLYGEPSGPDDILTGFNNITACEARDRDVKHRIAIVRNPWDRIVSAYYQKILSSGKSSLVNQKGIYKGMPFDEFVSAVYKLPITRENHIRNQTMYMFCESDFVPNWVIRLEDLEEEWRIIQAIAPLTDLGYRNQTEHPHYRDLYTDETRALIGKRYQRDIAILGYEF